MLEIGTGWGELAIRAAARGATVTSLTISTEQAELARQRIAEAGLTDRATVLLQAISLILALLIAIPLGILSATRQYSLLDNTTTVGSFIGLAIPNF